MSRRHHFTLLEVMIAIALVALAAGALFWRLDALIVRNRFRTDAEHLRTLLLSSRMLAINTQSDWELHLHETARGWNLCLSCREDPDQASIQCKLSPLEIQWEGQRQSSWGLDFFSSGRVSPQGTLTLRSSTSLVQWQLPALFRQEEGPFFGPAHPKEEAIKNN